MGHEDIKMFDPIKLLTRFYSKINSSNQIVFISDKSKNRIKLLLKNDKENGLIDIFKRANKEYKSEKRKYCGSDESAIKHKSPPQLSNYLDWNEVHKIGQSLWNELMSSAIKKIEPNSKGNSQLYKYLDAATEFEDLLYGLEKYYRDHTLHSLWVYLIGVELMGENGLLYNTTSKRLNWYLFNDIEQQQKVYPYPDYLVEWSKFRKKYFFYSLQEKRDAVWCIMALCHDLGYSLSKLSKLNNKVGKVLNFFHVSNFKQVGYSLDIDHQYLVEQYLELMAMDVRIVPGKNYDGLDKKISGIIKRAFPDNNDDERNKKRETELINVSKYQRSVLSKISKQVPDSLDLWGGCGKSLHLDIAKAIEEETLVKCYRDDSTYWRLCKAFERKEHGVLSAYLIYKILDIFADTYVRGSAEEWGLDDEEVLYNVIRGDILFAIAQHEFAYAHINQLGSMADILIICDELEEFTRLGRQLQARKYHDTAAKTGIEIAKSLKNKNNNKGATIIGDWFDIKMHYMSQHESEEEFQGFFARKAERICTLYSLDQDLTDDDVLYNPVASIKAIFSWTNPKTARAQKKTLVFELNRNSAIATLYSTKYRSDDCKECNKKCPLIKTSPGRKYKVKCVDDSIVIDLPCTSVVTLRNWLNVEEDE